MYEVSDTIYLNLFTSEDGSGTDVGIRLADAMRYTVEEFANLYQRTVCGAKRKDALDWGRKQVTDRTLLYREAANAAL